MSFNVDNCSVMHIRDNNNMQSNYNMSNQQLLTIDQQQDQGIIITKDLKWQKQTKKSCKMGNRVLGFIAHNFRYKNKELILPLYKFLVRPHLEHAVLHLRQELIKWRRYREEQQWWFQKSETIATTSESRTLISSALYKEDCKDN